VHFLLVSDIFGSYEQDQLKNIQKIKKGPSSYKSWFVSFEMGVYHFKFIIFDGQACEMSGTSKLFVGFYFLS
jgi:hypothetical protein